VQKLQQKIGLAAFETKMYVRDPDGAKTVGEKRRNLGHTSLCRVESPNDFSTMRHLGFKKVKIR
jgi:hypothetical protein